MQLKVCLFVCDDTAKITLVEMGWPVAYTTTRFSRTVMFTCQKKSISATSSIFLVIWHSHHLQLWFLLSKGSECQFEQRTKVLQYKLQKCRLRVNIASGSSRL